MPDGSTTAIVVYHGVSVDEAEAFRFVLSHLPGCRTVTAGTVRGTLTGVGGTETAEVALSEVYDPEIVAVPGGIACHRRTEIADWLRGISPRWMLASSTGSTLLAAADLLRDAPVAGHWLAGPILERYGAHASRVPVIVDGPIITCSGHVTAFRAALVVAEFYGGKELVTRIRADAAAARAGSAPSSTRTVWQRLRYAFLRRDRPPSPVRTPPREPLQDVEILDLGRVTPPQHPRSAHERPPHRDRPPKAP
ncbi:DJ-1/PfpI family protein [Phytoactinopolyspora halotolerans]|uniref:DJ-1/PfpI domain-containing protein n=1 Tax=Phytoactinopolyspora halotolerans TaxID=1981512 RepID=A0A6L9SCV4_9ACTN|nr:DJ-1/PfpI family protein [Phytoactinopolyspora halotolerans]NEE02839.1 hypothetical protein [Phytoactinopolyspora halotolerans]